MNLVLLGSLGQLAVERLLLLEDRLHLLHRDAVDQRAAAVLVHVLDAPTEVDVITLAELIQRRVGEDLLHNTVDLLLDLGGLRRNLGERLVRVVRLGRLLRLAPSCGWASSSPWERLSRGSLSSLSGFLGLSDSLPELSHISLSKGLAAEGDKLRVELLLLEFRLARGLDRVGRLGGLQPLAADLT